MFKLLSLNIGGLGDKHGSWDARRAAIAAAVRAADPDLVALQAAVIGKGHDQAEELAGDLGLAVHYEGAHEDAAEGTLMGVAFLSRAPLVARRFDLSKRAQTEDPFRRAVLIADVPGVGAVVNAHFSWVEAQALDNLDETLAAVPPGPALLIGDLNQTPGGAFAAEFARCGWTDLWAARRGGEDGFTFERGNLWGRIDHAWARGLSDRARDVTVVEGDFSDHLGLLVTLDS